DGAEGLGGGTEGPPPAPPSARLGAMAGPDSTVARVGTMRAISAFYNLPPARHGEARHMLGDRFWGQVRGPTGSVRERRGRGTRGPTRGHTSPTRPQVLQPP